MNKMGVMKRPCRPDGVWGPIQTNCTDLEILALCIKAKVKLLCTCLSHHDPPLPQDLALGSFS